MPFQDALKVLNNQFLGQGLSNSVLENGSNALNSSELINFQNGTFGVMSGIGSSAAQQAREMAGGSKMNAGSDSRAYSNAIGADATIMQSCDGYKMQDAEAKAIMGSDYVQREAMQGGGLLRLQDKMGDALSGAFRNFRGNYIARGDEFKDGIKGYGTQSTFQFAINVFGSKDASISDPNGNGSLLYTSMAAANNGALAAEISDIVLLGPDQGGGTTYKFEFFGPDGTTKVHDDYIQNVGSNNDGTHIISSQNFKVGDRPAWGSFGGTIKVTVNYSDRNINPFGANNSSSGRYDQCWQVNFGYYFTKP